MRKDLRVYVARGLVDGLRDDQKLALQALVAEGPDAVAEIIEHIGFSMPTAEPRATDAANLRAALNYALGRSTSSSFTVSSAIADQWADLDDDARADIKSAINEAIYASRAGMACDVREWQKILDLPENPSEHSPW